MEENQKEQRKKYKLLLYQEKKEKETAVQKMRITTYQDCPLLVHKAYVGIENDGELGWRTVFVRAKMLIYFLLYTLDAYYILVSRSIDVLL